MNKNELLCKAKEHINHVQIRINDKLKTIHERIKKLQLLLQTSRSDALIINQKLYEYANNQQTEFVKLKPSPYFVRCDVKFADEDEIKSMYFAKFSFNEEEIYSWVTPAAQLRFENPGEVEYLLPNGKKRLGKLQRKDQFMIVDGKIIFMATESLDNPRQLVHQEYLAQRKGTFILPEIVEQMEKAQDSVIRASYEGPLVVSGPAGSGKTTLALHRLAYLTQSPELAEIFPSSQMIVFVQDEHTRNYFSHLLPELGINDVKIITFSQWAQDQLKISDYDFVYRYGTDEVTKDLYEFVKNKALVRLEQTNLEINKKTINQDLVSILKLFYKDYLDSQQLQVLDKQLAENVLDRFDLTILLALLIKSSGFLYHTQDRYEELHNGKLRKKVVDIPIAYPYNCCR